jgi:hypothetical protein
LLIRAVIMVFPEHIKSGDFTGFPGIDFRETGADSGPEGQGLIIVF